MSELVEQSAHAFDALHDLRVYAIDDGGYIAEQGPSLVERYRQGAIKVHLHVRWRPFEEVQLANTCACFQRSRGPDDMNRKISREVATQGVRSGDGTNWRDEPMFVRVGELTEHPERAGNERVPSVLIRLQTLDDCLRSVGDTFEIPFASECEFVWPVTDRELGEPFVPGDNLLVPIEPSMACQRT